MSEKREVRPADSAERAYVKIRDMATELRFRPGERVNEANLAAQLKVSRTPVREALNRLSAEGFFLFVPNKGFVSRSLDLSDLVNLFELRAIIESGTFELACSRGSKEAKEDVASFWRDGFERYKSRDTDEILLVDEEFHLKIARCSGNGEAVSALAALNARIRFIRRYHIEHGHKWASMIDDHALIVDALLAGDVERGSRLLKSHASMTMDDAYEAMKEALFRAWFNDAVGRSTSVA